MDFSTLPKIELHLHLDCSLSFAVVSRIDPSITLQEYQNDFIAPAKCTNLADFFKRAPKGIALTQEHEKLRSVFSWSESHFLQCNLNALRSSFLPDTIKEHLEKQLRAGYGSVL